MMSRAHLPVILGIAALVWSALLILNGQSVSLQLLKPFSTVAGVIGVLAFAFDRWLWRWPPLHPWFVATPDLQGTWRGELVSDWSPEDGSQIPPIEAFLVIRQSFSTISMRLLTSESTSILLSGSVSKAVDGMDTAAGIYLNTPDPLRREGSPIHHGGLMLQIHGVPPAALRGEYWTDRKTQGKLQFGARSRKLFYGFEEATKATYESRQP